MEKQTGRLEAFSDGIFGVAITLLAVEIGIKEFSGASNTGLWQKILEKWPEYFAYFNSFATVLLIWMGHNQVIKHLRASNHWIVLLNGFVLLLVVLFPYPTRMVGTFIFTDARNTAIAFYAGFTGTITVSMYFLNLGIVYNKKLLLSPEKSLPWFRTMMRGQLLGMLIYAVAVIAAFYSPYISLGITFFMWVFWAVKTQDNDEELV